MIHERELVIVGDEAWTQEEWEAEQAKRERKRAEKRAYNARPDVKERTRQWNAANRAKRRAYNREWMARYRSSNSRLVGSLHDLACSGPTRLTGCVCHKVRCYSKPRRRTDVRYNAQDGGVSTDPDTLRGGPGLELTPRAGAAPRHEGKS